MRSFIYLFGSNLSMSAISIVTTTVLARLISPSDFGVISVAMIFVGFFEVLSSSGLGATMIQQDTLNRKDIGTGFSVSFLLSFCAVILFYLLIPLIDDFFNMDKLRMTLQQLAFVIPFALLTQIPYAILVRENKYKRIGIINIVSFTSFSLTAIILALLDWGLVSLIYGHIMRFVVKFLIYLIIFLKTHQFQLFWHKEFLDNLSSYGREVSFGVVVNYLSRRVDNFLLGKYFGNTQLAYYTKSYGLIELSINPIGKVYQIIFFRRFATFKDDEKLKKEFLDSLEIALWIFIPIAVFIFFSAKEIILLVLGKSWVSSEMILIILAPSIPFRFIIKIANATIKGIGKSKVFQNFQILYFAMIFLSIMLFKSFDIGIVIIVISSSTIVLASLITFYCLQELKTKPTELVESLKHPFIILLGCSVLNLIYHFVGNQNLNLFITLILIFVLTFVTPCLMFLFHKNINPRITIIKKKIRLYGKN